MIDPEQRTVVVTRPGEEARESSGTLVWRPNGAVEPLEIYLAELVG